MPDIIPDRTVTIVAGDGGDGKTTLMSQLAAATSAGRPWLGYSPEPAPVLFVSAEDDVDELHRRLDAIAKGLNIGLSELADLHLVPLAGKDAVMAVPQGRAGIVNATAVFHGLVALVEKIRPRVVMVDALADVFGGEENARAQARQFIGLWRGLAINHDLAVVLIAHPSLTGMSSGTGTSGSTAWSNSVRSRLYLARLKGDDSREIDPDLRVLRVKKSNCGPAGMELRLRWRNGGFILDEFYRWFRQARRRREGGAHLSRSFAVVRDAGPRRVAQPKQDLCADCVRRPSEGRWRPKEGVPGRDGAPSVLRSHSTRDVRVTFTSAQATCYRAFKGGMTDKPSDAPPTGFQRHSIGFQWGVCSNPL